MKVYFTDEIAFCAPETIAASELSDLSGLF